MTLPPYQQYLAFKESLLGVESQLSDATRSFAPSSVLDACATESMQKITSMLRDSDGKVATISRCVAPATEQAPWEARKISNEIGLLLDEHRIMNEQGLLGDRAKYRPNWSDITKLTSTLSSLKTKGYTSGKDAKLLDKVSANLSKACFEGRELQRIGEALTTKLNEEMEQRGLEKELAKYELVLQDLLPDVDNCESLFEAAMLNGDVCVAEEIAYNQLALQERLLRLVEDQYPAIQNKQADAKEFRRQRRWAIFRTAGNDINGVIELKARHIEACEEDMQRLATAMRERQTIIQQNELKLETDRIESNKFLANNVAQQKAIFTKVDKLREQMLEYEAALKVLQVERSKEVDRVLKKEEEFADFKAMVQGFMAGADKYMERLHTTLENTRLTRDLCGMLQEFMLSGCSTMESKFHKADALLAEMVQKVDKQYLKHVTGYILNVGRLHHKKQSKIKELSAEIENAQVRLEFCVDSLDPLAKRHAQQRDGLMKEKATLDREAAVLVAKLENTRKTWEGVSKRLKAAGVPFADPEAILEQSQYIRQKRLLDMRDMLNITVDKIGTTLDRESTTIQRDREMLRLKMMETHKAKKASIGLKAPRPPQSAVQQAHSKAHSRYTQIVTEMKLEEISEHSKAVQKRTTEQKDENGGRSIQEMVLSTRPQSAPTQQHTRTTPTSAQRPNSAAPTSYEASAMLGKTLLARFTYKARSADELSFVKGDLILCLSQSQEEGWYVGSCNQRSGLFPCNYVNIVSEEDEFDF